MSNCVSIRLKSEYGDVCSDKFQISNIEEISAQALNQLCNAFLKNDEQLPYSFFIGNQEITTSLATALKGSEKETAVDIVYVPQAIFRVRPVARCTSSLSDHKGEILTLAFSPEGQHLASGSGDHKVIFWDLTTETCQFKGEVHKTAVRYVAWSPDGRKLASGCKQGYIVIWDPKTGKQIGKTLYGHSKPIMYIVWQPLHLYPQCRYLASASEDSDIRIWDIIRGSTERILSGHTQKVSCLRWSGSGLLYSGARDGVIKVWRADTGELVKNLKTHSHWINALALSTDYVLRTGPYDPADASVVHKEISLTDEQLQSKALHRYQTVLCKDVERMVSCSDDCVLYLWKPDKQDKPIQCMTGHQQVVIDVRFSPDTRRIASASFDKSIKLWDGKTGEFLSTLRGHVQNVYQLAWSADSRLIVSGSKDSTLKVWSTTSQKLHTELPGHGDAVYAVDWSPDGQHVASGGKDTVLKIWRT